MDRETFGHRQKGRKGHMVFRRKGTPGRRSSICRGPEAGVSLAGLSTAKRLALAAVV